MKLPSSGEINHDQLNTGSRQLRLEVAFVGDFANTHNAYSIFSFAVFDDFNKRGQQLNCDSVEKFLRFANESQKTINKPIERLKHLQKMDLRSGLIFNKCFCCSKNFNVSQLIELNTNSVVIGDEMIAFIDLILDICLLEVF